MASEASVRVFARFRPLNKRELGLGSKPNQFLSLTESTVKLPSDLLPHEVSFDKVFEKVDAVLFLLSRAVGVAI